jgi:hypothetical protein
MRRCSINHVVNITVCLIFDELIVEHNLLTAEPSNSLETQELSNARKCYYAVDAHIQYYGERGRNKYKSPYR